METSSVEQPREALGAGCYEEQGPLAPEPVRLQTLLRYRILDTPPERQFDSIASYAALLCQAPMALVSFVGKKHLYFKARVGIAAASSSREGSFCDEAIRTAAIFLVQDARKDPRFISNRYVVGSPYVRFYAAAPLIGPHGALIGTLCVLDAQPRSLGEREAAGLRMLADLVVALLDLRRHQQEQGFLRQVGDALTSSLDLETVLIHASEVSVPFLADWCVLDSCAGDGPWRRYVVCADPADEPLADALRASAPVDTSHVTDTPTLVDRSAAGALALTQEPLLSALRPGTAMEVIGQAGVQGLMKLPLRVRGRTLGMLTLLGREPRAEFGDIELSLATTLAGRVSQALDNASLYKAAQDAIAVRDDFLSIAAHELRTPVTVLSLQSDSLDQASRRGTETFLRVASTRLGRIAAQIERLKRLIQEIITVSQIRSGRVHPVRERVDLDDLVRKLVAEFGTPAASVGASLTFTGPGPVLVETDRDRITQVVSNLLSNGLRYGLGKPVDVVLTLQGQVARIVVRDRGLGIAPQDHARIFERFERLNSVRNYGGLGLGLWVARELLRSLHGSICVESRLGEGAVFTVELPLAPG